MNTSFIKNIDIVYYVKPGEKVSDTLLEQLKKINEQYSKTKDFPKYQKALKDLFNIPDIAMTRQIVDYLSGFVEGEGSVSVSAMKNKQTRAQLTVDPMFNVAQHVNGIVNLFLILSFFKTGRIRYKVGSKATFYFVIDNRTTLMEKVVPFYENYLSFCPNPVKIRRVSMLKQFLHLMEEKAHLHMDRMIKEVLPLWNDLRMQTGQKNQPFGSLKEAQDYVREAYEKNKK